MQIRNEKPSDFRAVEELTRKAFWNVYAPGCTEHYLAHVLREHEDFVPELDFVVEEDGQVVANIMFSKAKLTDPEGNVKPILSFGPLGVLPEYQRRGYGKKLMQHGFEKAMELGYDTVVIFGNPENYITSGFRSCKHYGVTLDDGSFPTSLLVKELRKGAIPKGSWRFSESEAFEVDPEAAEAFDKDFAPMEKAQTQKQELFYIYSHSRVI